jgi:putative ABC transport system substrate-binding protein
MRRASSPAAFVRRLHELGWIEGSTVAIEYRWAEGHAERLSAFAAELVRLKVGVIVTSATPPTIAAKRATSVVPIVAVAVGDPVGSGLVASLARPGGNVTGLSIQSVDAVSKQVELLRDVVPNLHRLAVFANESNPMNRRQAEEVQAAAHALGLEVAPLEVRLADDIAPAFAALDGRADAALRRGRSALLQQHAYNQRPGAQSAIAGHVQFPGGSRRGRSAVIRSKLS